MWLNKDQGNEPKDSNDKATSPQLCTSTIIPPPPYVPLTSMVSSNVTPVDGNYGHNSIQVKSELTELHTVSEPSLVLSPQQQGNLVFSEFGKWKLCCAHGNQYFSPTCCAHFLTIFYAQDILCALLCAHLKLRVATLAFIHGAPL